MFHPGDPTPEPFEWGPRKWASEKEYDQDLAKFLGSLACGPKVPDAQTRGLAKRALLTADLVEDEVGEPDRLWPRLFAARLIGPNCPPANGLPEEMRRQLEQLAARVEPPAAAPETSPSDEAE